MTDPNQLATFIITLLVCGLTLVNFVLFSAFIWFVLRPRPSAAEGGPLAASSANLESAQPPADYGPASHNHELNDLLRVEGAKLPEGAHLVWRDGAWAPVAFDPERIRMLAHPLARIERREARVYECWFTIDGPGNQGEVIELPASAIQVFRETQTGPKYLARIEVIEVRQVRRNLFEIQLRQESERLRFSLDLLNIPTAEGRSLSAFAKENNLQFLGLRGEATVTLHVRGGA